MEAPRNVAESPGGTRQSFDGHGRSEFGLGVPNEPRRARPARHEPWTSGSGASQGSRRAALLNCSPLAVAGVAARGWTCITRYRGAIFLSRG